MSQEQLTQALNDAATSLETISRLAGKPVHPDGTPTYLDSFPDVRSYAKSRAAVARAALSATQPAQAAQGEQEAELRRSLAAAEATLSERNAEIISLHKRLKAAQGAGEVVAPSIEIAALDWRNPNIELPPIGKHLLVVVSDDRTVWPSHYQDQIRPIDAFSVFVVVMKSSLTTFTPTKPHELHMTEWSIAFTLGSKINPSSIRLWAALPEVQEGKAFTSKDQQLAFYRQCSALGKPASTQPAAGADVRLLDWAVGRWRDEVQNRPLVNKNRRPLDDAWRQVVRFAGGDPDTLLGPSHDAAIAASGRQE